MVKYMFEMPSDSDFEMLYGNLKQQETISFWSTSSFVVQHLMMLLLLLMSVRILNFHELDSIITLVSVRILKSTSVEMQLKLTLTKTYERNGILDFMKILEQMPSFATIEFGVEDIVRSGLCKEYLTTKLALGM